MTYKKKYLTYRKLIMKQTKLTGNPGQLNTTPAIPVQKIVDWMNKHPEKLFGGKFSKFEQCPIGIRGIIIDKPYPFDKSIDYSFHDTRLLRELAKAKWGIRERREKWIDVNTKEIVPYDSDCDCERDIMLAAFYYLQQWVVIEDEQEIIETIAHDILS